MLPEARTTQFKDSKSFFICKAYQSPKVKETEMINKYFQKMSTQLKVTGTDERDLSPKRQTNGAMTAKNNKGKTMSKIDLIEKSPVSETGRNFIRDESKAKFVRNDQPTA